MRIAIPYTQGEIDQHFGHSEQFKIYVVDNKELVDSYLLPVNGTGHEAAADLLVKAGVTAVLCGARRVKNALENAGAAMLVLSSDEVARMRADLLSLGGGIGA